MLGIPGWVRKWKAKECLLVLMVLGVGLPASGQVLFEEVPVDTASLTDPWMKALGDLNGDGQLDLIVCYRSGPLVWHEYPDWTRHTINNGSWSSGTTTDVDAADIDGDGDADVLLANGYWFENPDLPSGDPVADAWAVHTYGSDVGHDVQIANLDNDGDLDVVTRNQNAAGDEVLIFRNEGGGSWTRISLTANMPEGEGITLFDLDGNGYQDLVLGDRWFANDGDLVSGAWTMRLYVGSAASELDTIVATGDINGDGNVDVAVAPAESAGQNSALVWYEAPDDPTSGSWTKHDIVNPAESVHHSLQLGDFDSDGDLDVATAEMHQGGDPDDVYLMYNDNGDGLSWTKQVVSTEGSHNLQAGDIDADGDTDFFGANWNSSQSADGADIKLWRNRTGPQGLPLGNWERHLIDGALPYKTFFVQAEDLNGDDRCDIVTGPYWYENPGAASGNWTQHTIGSPLNQFALIEDFDGDSHLDLFGTNGNDSGHDFHWARNDGAGNFTVYSNISSPSSGDFLQGVTSGNYVGRSAADDRGGMAPNGAGGADVHAAHDRRTDHRNVDACDDYRQLGKRGAQQRGYRRRWRPRYSPG